MYLKVLKHQESYSLCFWKLINRKRDMAHSFTRFKLSGFKFKKHQAILKHTTVTFRCLCEYANVESAILVVKRKQEGSS